MAVQAAEAEALVDNNMTTNQRNGTMRGGDITRGRGQGMRGTMRGGGGGGHKHNRDATRGGGMIRGRR
jgi:hypothetical protein